MATTSSWEQDLERARQLAEEDKIMQAFDILRRLQTECATESKDTFDDKGVEASSAASSSESLNTALGSDPVLSDVLKVAKHVEHLRRDLGTDAGWSLQKADNRGRTLYRVDDDSVFHTIRVEGWVDAPLFEVMAVLYELDLHPRWFPSSPLFGIKSSQRHKTFSNTHLCCHMNLYCVWPWDNRDMAFDIRGVDCLDEAESLHRQVVILLESLTPEEETQYEVPAAGSGVTRMQMHDGCIILTPAMLNPDMLREDNGAELPALPPNPSSNLTLVQIAARIDPKLSTVPSCVVNVGVRHLAHMVVDKIRDEAVKVATDPEFQQRIKASDEFYGFIQRRLDESFKPPEAKDDVEDDAKDETGPSAS